MARGRIISATLGGSRKFRRLGQQGGALGEFAQALYPLIVANTDAYGLYKSDAETMKLNVFPASHRSEPEFEVALQLLHKTGLIRLYEVEGQKYLEVLAFDEHQPGLHPRGSVRRGQPQFPPPPESPISPTASRRPFPERERETETEIETETETKATTEYHSSASSRSADQRNDPESKLDHRRNGQEPKPVKKQSVMTDDEFLDSLQQNPAYTELNVRKLYGKMLVWCDVNGKQPSRRRLVNWLNREDKPMNGTRTTPRSTDVKTERLLAGHQAFVERNRPR